MTDQELMAQIKADMGQPIRAAIVGTDLQESFLAALVANESTGNPTVKRLEPGVLASLGEVLAGRKSAFGGITSAFLTPLLTKAAMSTNPLQSAAGRLLDYATSWGPTQIMGYQVIGSSISLDNLASLPQHFAFCAILLRRFIREWNIADADPEKSEKLFRCWNTGRPEGAPTTDPDYVAKGLSRMAIYAGLP